MLERDTAMCDISFEREFNHLLYGELQVQIGKTSLTDVCVTLPPNLG